MGAFKTTVQHFQKYNYSLHCGELHEKINIAVIPAKCEAAVRYQVSLAFHKDWKRGNEKAWLCLKGEKRSSLTLFSTLLYTNYSFEPEVGVGAPQNQNCKVFLEICNS